MNCAMCGSENIAIERCPGGKRLCHNCGYEEINRSKDDHVVLTVHQDRTNQLCMCHTCGTIQRCTPSNNFYSTPDTDDKLLCEKCFHEYLGHKLNKEAIHVN